eukprot:jgi/Botrbrau1/17916/Bobra.50_1s0017.1
MIGAPERGLDSSRDFSELPPGTTSAPGTWEQNYFIWTIILAHVPLFVSCVDIQGIFEGTITYNADPPLGAQDLRYDATIALSESEEIVLIRPLRAGGESQPSVATGAPLEGAPGGAPAPTLLPYAGAPFPSARSPSPSARALLPTARGPIPSARAPLPSARAPFPSLADTGAGRASLPSAVQSPVAVLTDRYDGARSVLGVLAFSSVGCAGNTGKCKACWQYRQGVNGRETILTPAMLKAGNFGKLAELAVDGQAYTHPLVVPGITVNGKQVTGVIVATQRNFVYMFDVATGALLWVTKQLGNPLTPADVGNCSDVKPYYGITGTPVVDMSANVVYVAANSKPSLELILEGPSSNWTLYSLDLSTGLNKYRPLVLQGSATLSNVTVTFSPTFQLQRAGLAISNGKVLVSFGAHCDFFDYSGWVFATNPVREQITAIWRSTNQFETDGGGVWQSGIAPAVDDFGNVYLTTGSGLREPEENNYGNAVVKLPPPPDSGEWQAVDYFMPSDQSEFDEGDLASGAATLFNIGPKQVLAVAGKAGKTWVLDVSNMGKFGVNAYQSIPNTGFMFGGQLFDPILKRLWINPQPFTTQKNLQVWQLASTGYFESPPIGTGPRQDGFGGTPTLTHNNGTNGIVWTTGSYGIRAYDASATGNITPIYTDNPGNFVKFQHVVVANGLVFLAGDGTVSIYGPK